MGPARFSNNIDAGLHEFEPTRTQCCVDVHLITSSNCASPGHTRVLHRCISYLLWVDEGVARLFMTSVLVSTPLSSRNSAVSHTVQYEARASQVGTVRVRVTVPMTWIRLGSPVTCVHAVTPSARPSSTTTVLPRRSARHWAACVSAALRRLLAAGESSCSPWRRVSSKARRYRGGHRWSARSQSRRTRGRGTHG